jgi:hypothetical protein
MSTTRLPTGSWIGNPAPTAAARVSSTSVAERRPADVTASSTARRSTFVLPAGTHTRARGRGNRVTPSERMISRSMLAVISKSAITPRSSGRTTWTFPGLSASMRQACEPAERTCPLRALIATTVGSS